MMQKSLIWYILLCVKILMIETIVKKSRSLSRPRLMKFVYSVCVLLFAGLYAHRYFRNGFYLPEEPYILDFSSLLRIPRDGTDVGMPLGTNGQISIAFPWSGISYLWYKIGGSTYGHVQLILFIRTAILVFLIQKLYQRFMSGGLAIVLAAVAFSTTPVRSAVLYTHWFSHLVLVLTILLFLLDERQKTANQYKKTSVLITGLSVSVFSNPPHLLTGWLALPVGILLIRLIRKNDLQEALKKARILVVIGVLVYLLPAYLYLQNWSILREAKHDQIFTSVGNSFVNGLQGFGSWWTFAKFVGSDSDVYFYDFTNVELATTTRGLLRLILISSVVAYFLFRSDKLNGRIFRDRSLKKKTFYTLTIVSSVLILLSSLARYSWFWDIRDRFSLVLGMFRDPYPKFAPMAQIFLYATFGSLFAVFSSKFLSRSCKLLCAVTGIYLISPIFNPQLGISDSRPIQRDAGYSWSRDSLQSLEYAAKSLEHRWDNLCLYDLGSSRLQRVFLQLKYPQVFRNLRDLVPSSELEAYLSTGRNADLRVGCLPKDELALVLKGDSQDIYSERDVRSSAGCVIDSNVWFMIIRTGCIIDAEVRIGSDLVNQPIFLSGAKSSYPVIKSSQEPSWIALNDPFWLVLTTKQPIAGTITIEYTDTPLDSFGDERKKFESPFVGNIVFDVRDLLPCFDYHRDCWTGIFSVELKQIFQPIDSDL